MTLGDRMKLRKLFHLLVLLALVACAPTLGPSISTPTTGLTPATAVTIYPEAVAISATPSATATAAPASAKLTNPPPTNTEPSATILPASASPTSAASPTPTAAACTPTDQDLYVYNPGRLRVMAACLRVSGVIDVIRTEADGDLHILLKVDPEFANLLRATNQGEELGDLVIEPVCAQSVTQADAESTCATDRDPYAGPFPQAGQHVWIEGRYVLDLEHGSWAELHPLYRWGTDGAKPVNTIAPPPAATRIGVTFTPPPVEQATATQPAQVTPTDTEAAAKPTDTQAPAATQPAASGFTLISLTSPVKVNQHASASIQTQAGASRSIGYVTPHGTKSKAQGLGPETAGGDGVCSWSWDIGPGTEPGTGSVTISAGGQTLSFPIDIQ
jgi:hypothetical protein